MSSNYLLSFLLTCQDVRVSQLLCSRRVQDVVNGITHLRTTQVTFQEHEAMVPRLVFRYCATVELAQERDL